MKQFVIFLIIFLILIAGFSIFSNFYLNGNPKKVVIAIDTSYNMNNSWQQVMETVKTYENLKYTSFALITDKVLIHSWDKELKTYKLGNIKPYGPTDNSVFMDNNKYPELKTASQIIVLTSDMNISMFQKDMRYKVIQMK